eukprot:1000530-Prorocentrum_minimum.AAC.1
MPPARNCLMMRLPCAALKYVMLQSTLSSSVRQASLTSAWSRQSQKAASAVSLEETLIRHALRPPKGVAEKEELILLGEAPLLRLGQVEAVVPVGIRLAKASHLTVHVTVRVPLPEHAEGAVLRVQLRQRLVERKLRVKVVEALQPKGVVRHPHLLQHRHALQADVPVQRSGQGGSARVAKAAVAQVQPLEAQVEAQARPECLGGFVRDIVPAQVELGHDGIRLEHLRKQRQTGVAQTALRHVQCLQKGGLREMFHELARSPQLLLVAAQD